MRVGRWNAGVAALLACCLLAACRPGGTAGGGAPPIGTADGGTAAARAETEAAQAGEAAAEKQALGPAEREGGKGLSKAEPESSVSSEEGAAVLPERDDLPAPGFVPTAGLGREIYARWEKSMADGLYTYGGLSQIFSDHPEFVYDQSGRLPSRGEKDPAQGWLTLYRVRSPGEDMILRERFAQFAEKVRDGTPGCIVILSSAAPLGPVPLYMEVLTCDGSFDALRKDSYSYSGRLYGSCAAALTETETEWLVTDERGVVCRYPKYGYEPVPFDEIAGEGASEAGIGAALEEIFKEELEKGLPGDAAILSCEARIRGRPAPDMPQPEHGWSGRCDIYDLNGVYRENGKDYDCSGSYAVARDLSRYYKIEDMGGNWLLRGRPRPAPGYLPANELIEEISTRWDQAMQEGMDAPGALGEFLQTHPQFLYNQSGRMKTGDGNRDNARETELLFYKVKSPDEDLINRDRLAQFARNVQNGEPDCIVMLVTGAPLTPIPLYLEVLTYDGKGGRIRTDSYAAYHGLGAPAVGLVTLRETGDEWIFEDEDGRLDRYPKYGYEPVPFTEIVGEGADEARVRAAVMELFGPKGPEILTSEITPRERFTEGCGETSPELLERYYIYDIRGKFTAGDGGPALDHSGSYAVAKDLSCYFQIEQMGGNWMLYARPKAAPAKEADG